MIIVLEGFDGSGKSTLAEKLSKHLNFQFMHPGKPPKDREDELAHLNNQSGLFAFAEKLNVIMDRCTCTSQYVYRMGESTIEYRDFIIDLASKHIFVIHCVTDGLQNQEFLVSEHDDVKTIEHAKSNALPLIARYDQLMQLIKNNHGNVISYDYRKDSYEKLLVTLFEMLHLK